jgi:hypothetical protein
MRSAIRPPAAVHRLPEFIESPFQQRDRMRRLLDFVDLATRPAFGSVALT